MSQLEAAQRHLTRALRRLETALERRISKSPGEPAGPERRELGQIALERDQLARNLATMHEQCDRLSVALNEAEHENRTLREVNGRVARRLDGSIGELDRLLGG